jgi:ABC-type transporter Mla maintaining outer membrane lipid asymmetry ATPase subunit MlaF
VAAVQTQDGRQAGTSAVELTGVGKSFGEVRAVDGVDLEIRAGEFFSMLGPRSRPRARSRSAGRT